ncbi:MAG: imidazolonepropionase [Phycisphaerales bacterium]
MTGDLLIRRAHLRAFDGPTDVLCSRGRIAAVAPSIAPPDGTEVFDARGRALLPGFVDCHTHACWAGQRLGEWEQKLAGRPYLDILAAGGGIMSTVRAVREATRAELAQLLLDRLRLMLRHGTTTVEVKSGYGLDTPTEIKMLEAIADAASQWPGTVVPTACIGHARDPAIGDGGVRRAIDETLPAVTAAFPGIAVDAFCEAGAWTLAETLELLEKSANAGHPIRVHADQFNDLGCVCAAAELGAVSVDHLEASSAETLRRLAATPTVGVMLPACGLHLDDRYAPGRSLLDAGGRVALATNLNPGSAPCYSMQMVLALAVRKLGLRFGEALNASTAVPAAVLGLTDRGRIATGARADLVLLESEDARDAAFLFGGNLVSCVWIKGQRVV